MKKVSVALLFTLALQAVSQTPAPNQGAGGEMDVLRLFYAEPELVQTPSRVLEDARTAPAIIEVITGDELRNMGARTLSDALKSLESVYISVQPNTFEVLWVRGVRSRYNNKVLLMVDGVARRDLEYEHAFVDRYIPLTNVERVEFIRGPGSALYGSDAFVGVINVITKRAPDLPTLEARVGAGDFGTQEYSLEGGAKGGWGGLYAYAHAFDTEGDGPDYSITGQKQALKQNPQYQASGGIAYERNGFLFHLERKHFYHTFFYNDVPTWRWKDDGYWYNDTYADASYSRRLSEKVDLKVLGFWQYYDWHQFRYVFNTNREVPGATWNDVKNLTETLKTGRTFGLEVQGNWRANERHQIVSGLSFERQSLIRAEQFWTKRTTGVTTLPFYTIPGTLDTWALYLQDTWKPAPWASFTIGARADKHGLFGQVITPRLAAAVHPGAKFVLKVLYGEAFRTPTFREFFAVDLTASYFPGNRDLKPERIKTAEVQASYIFSKRVEGHVGLYRQQTSDAIYSESNRPYENHPGMRVTGIEAGLKMAWESRATAFVNYSRIFPTDGGLYNMPYTLAHLGWNLPIRERLNWNLSASYISSRPRDPADRYTYDASQPPYHRPDVPGYLLVDTALRLMKLPKGFEVDAAVHNLFDQRYFDPTFEPTSYNDIERPGRTFEIRVSYRWTKPPSPASRH